jgi:hypothetical protein
MRDLLELKFCFIDFVLSNDDRCAFLYVKHILKVIRTRTCSLKMGEKKSERSGWKVWLGSVNCQRQLSSSDQWRAGKTPKKKVLVTVALQKPSSCLPAP